ncbi:helix-turn-helix transcriptional regulator [Ciceribacter thiooxidans]|uniref:Autoinducer binding domain-containing protein n=1 Tax=Ciceribacter thiooxidans TaxID=1969821 RepID=A0ABV7I329_9HYPH|nr:autoinducer binding domain-containing protein [Ciceribacter thiooxidans]
MATNELSIGLERTLSFLSDVRSINNHADLTTAVKRATATFGIEKILAGFIPKPGTLPGEQLRHVLLADWPEDWATIYFHRGLLFQDPTIRRVLRAQPTFTWSELPAQPDLSTNERYVMASAADFALRNGCTVPLLSLDGRHVGFSFAGAYIDDAPEAKGVMTLIASFAFGRAVELKNNEVRARVRLTARERETLAWVAAGKTDWEIGVIFGVSDKAIAKHVHNIRMKLGAVNRAHAVAEAFRLRLIS